MKKFIALIMILLPIGAMATVPEFVKLFDDYSSTEGVTVVTLTGEMLKAQADGGNEENFKYIDSLNILQCEDAGHSKKISKRIDKVLKGTNLKSVTDIKVDESTRVHVLLNNENEQVKDAIVYVVEGDEIALIVISGDIPESMVGDLVSVKDIF